jgi:integrase
MAIQGYEPRRKAKGYGKLTALAVARASKRGMYGDGNGLWLQIARNGSKSWVLRYKVAGRTRHYGIGPLHTVSLTEARTRAAAARLLLLDGTDPVEARRKRKAEALIEAGNNISFADAAEQHIVAQVPGWKAPKMAQQWRSHMKTYANPFFGKLPVAAVDTGLVTRALTPIWTTKPETASRVRARIESVLDAAKVKGYRTGDNPARWAGHLEHILSARPSTEHHPAIPYTEIAGFMTDLRARDATSAKAMQFLILTATRSTETLGARWEEFDLQGKVWIVPASRMKKSKGPAREHRVPLTDRAVAIVKAMQDTAEGPFVFPSAFKRSKQMSGNALLDLLKRMERSDITPHGMRTCFRTWAGDETNHQSAVAEACLAHVVKGVEAVYLRTDFFEKRRKLMEDWSNYCDATTTTGNVIQMRGA